MRIVIFGSSGATGKYLVERALETGHEVVAFVRDPSKLRMRNENLAIVKGNVRNQDDVDKAIAGSQAVFSTLGSRPGVSPICADGTVNIISAMKKRHVDRLIVESACGAGETKKGFYGKTLRLMIRPLMEDKDAMESAIGSSGLRWTVVRPTSLTNGKMTGNYQSGMGVNVGVFPKIARSDVADFMLRQLKEAQYLRKTPTITS